MSNTKFSFESKKIESTEQPQPQQTIEPHSSFDSLKDTTIAICVACLIVFAITVLWYLYEHNPKILFGVVGVVGMACFVAFIVYFDNEVVKFFNFVQNVIKWFFIIIGWLIVAAIAIWLIIAAFGALSAPIASMPIWAVIILVWYVSSMYSK
jgi:magnesium-transporting ATPase (P-type)